MKATYEWDSENKLCLKKIEFCCVAMAEEVMTCKTMVFAKADSSDSTLIDSDHNFCPWCGTRIRMVAGNE